MDGTLLRANYCVYPLVFGKEWTILLDGDRVGTVRQEGFLYGWRDKQGGHWFSTFDGAAKARVGSK